MYACGKFGVGSPAVFMDQLAHFGIHRYVHVCVWVSLGSDLRLFSWISLGPTHDHLN